MRSNLSLVYLYLILSISFIKINSLKRISSTSSKLGGTSRQSKTSTKSLIQSKGKIVQLSQKTILSARALLSSKSQRKRSTMSPDGIIMITALALDVATILINVAAKFVEGKIYEQKMKIVGGVQQLFFHQMAIKENLCFEFLTINDVYGDLLVSLKLQYIADQIFLTSCQNDIGCYIEGVQNHLPNVTVLLDSTLKMKDMLDGSIGVVRSIEDMICTKTIDFTGEVEYIRKRTQIGVGIKAVSNQDISDMITSVAWNAIVALITAIQKGGVTMNFSMLFDAAANLKEMIDKPLDKIKEKLGIKSFTDAILSKVDSDYQEWNIYKKLPFIMGAVETVMANIDLKAIITAELNVVSGVTKPAATTTTTGAKTTDTSAFSIAGGKLTVKNECVKLPIAGCTPAEWLKSLKEMFEMLKIIFNKEKWNDSGPAGLLEIAGAFLFMGMFGVKMYYFINNLVQGGGSPVTLNPSMTAAVSQFWFKTLEFIKELVEAQAKISGLSIDNILEDIDKNTELNTFTKAAEYEKADETLKKSIDKAKENRNKIIKTFISTVSAFILLPLIKKGITTLVSIIGQEFVKNYLWQAIAVVKLVYSIYKFSMAIYNLVMKILELKKWKEEAKDEIELQKIYKGHLVKQANYVKCKYLIYLWNMFDQHSIVANENSSKHKMKRRYIASLRFKENSDSFKIKAKADDACATINVDTSKTGIETEMTENEFLCTIKNTLSPNSVTLAADADESKESKELGIELITEACKKDPNYCRKYLPKFIWDELEKIKVKEGGKETNEATLIAKRIFYSSNFGPITSAIVVNKKRLIFSTEFLSKRGFHFYRDATFGEHKAIMYSRRPNSGIAVDNFAKIAIDLDGENKLNALFKSKVKSSLIQYEIVNDFPEEEDSTKKGKFNAIVIGYAKVVKKADAPTVKLMISFAPTQDKAPLKDWNIGDEQWSEYKIGAYLISKVEKTDPSGMANQTILLDAYLIPSARQFDEKWIYYTMTPTLIDDTNFKYSFYSIVDNRFSNDWNSNENLMDSADKVLSIIAQPIRPESDSSTYEIKSDLCGKVEVKTNAAEEIKADLFPKSGGEASAVSKSLANLKQMEKIYQARAAKTNEATNSIKKALCKIDCYFQDHKQKFFSKAAEGEDLKIVSGGYDLEIKYDDKGEIQFAAFQDKAGVDSPQRPKLLIFKISKDVIDMMKMYLFNYQRVIFEEKKAFLDIGNYKTFDVIQNRYLNPYSYDTGFGYDFQESIKNFIASGANHSNEKDAKKLKAGLEKAIADFNKDEKTEEGKVNLANIAAKKKFEEELKKNKDLKPEPDIISDYTIIRQIRDKNNGIMFFHNTSPPKDGSNYKGKAIFPDLDVVFSGFGLTKGDNFHVALPFFMNPSLYFVTAVLGTFVQEEKDKDDSKKTVKKSHSILQLQTRDKINEDSLYKVPIASLNYIELKIKDKCLAPEVADTLDLSVFNTDVDTGEKDEKGKAITERINPLLSRGYVPFFPQPETPIKDFISPNNYFYSFSFSSSICLMSRMWIQYNYFINVEFDKVCEGTESAIQPKESAPSDIDGIQVPDSADDNKRLDEMYKKRGITPPVKVVGSRKKK